MDSNGKTRIPLSALLAAGVGFSGCAMGQEVAVYGLLDGAMVTQRTGVGGSTTAVVSGISSSSRIGFRGREDLGGGLRAVFRLEMGLDLNSGALASYSGNYSAATPSAPAGPATSTGFNRRSFVGLEGPFGTLTIGRDYTPIYWAALNQDVFHLGMFGSLQQAAQPAGGSELFARISNAVFYKTPDFKGFHANAVYGLGAQSAGTPGTVPRGADKFYGVGVEYSGHGLTADATHQELRVPLAAGSPPAFTGALMSRKDDSFAVKYEIAGLAVSTGHWKLHGQRDASDTWLGASYTFGSNTVMAQAQRLRQANPTGLERRGTVIGVAYVHDMSKLTQLYVSYGHVSNNATGAFAVIAADYNVAPGGPGMNPSALAAGIRHSF